MKSQQPEDKLKEAEATTSCKECVFAKFEEGTQTSCLTGRLDKFLELDNVVEAYDNDKEFYVITRVCGGFRTQEWSDRLLDSHEHRINQLELETGLKFSVMIDIDELTEEGKANTLSWLSEVDYNREKIRIVLSDVNNGCAEEVVEFWNSIKALGYPTILMKSVHELARDMDGFPKMSNTFYTCKITPTQRISSEVFKKVNSLVNINLANPVVIKTGDVHLLLFMLVNMEYLQHGNFKGFSDWAIKQASEEGKFLDLDG